MKCGEGRKGRTLEGDKRFRYAVAQTHTWNFDFDFEGGSQGIVDRVRAR